jgi:hypothetical protein
MSEPEGEKRGMSEPEQAAHKLDPRPWGHHTSFELVTEDWIGGEGEDVTGMKLVCTCGFEFPFSLDEDPSLLSKINEGHLSLHPLPPLATAHVGDSVVMVMAVPGPHPDGRPVVHMSITVPRDIYDDGRRLTEFLGPIGSRSQFQSKEMP